MPNRQRRKKANIMLANCSTPFSVLLPFVLLLLSMAPPMIDCQYYYEQSAFLAPPSPIPAPPTKTTTTSLTIERVARKGSSMETMVDVTNRFGVAVLSTHSAGNKDNIAFSPYGLLSVMIALYEGAPRDSTTSRQVRSAVGLPSDDAILRVGYRDVHRRLRRYFHNQENLLSGIIFNKENITIRSEYEDILRFYGYDLATYDGFDKPGTEAPDEENSTLATSTTKDGIMVSTTTEADESEESEESDEEEETEEPTTEMSPPTTTMTTTTTMAAKTSKSTKKPRKSRKTTKATTTSTTTAPPSTTTMKTTTTVKTTLSTTTTPRIRAPLPPQTTTTRPPRPTTITTVNTFRPTLPTTTEEDYSDTTTELPPTTTYPPFFAAIPAAVLTGNRSARLLGGYRKRQPLITLDPTPNWRPKRYVPHETIRIYDQNDNVYPHSIEAEYYVENLSAIPFSLPEHRTSAYYPSWYTTSSQYPPRNEVADIEHYFYLDGVEKINVPFRIYNTILYHAYVPAIQADVVKFELDSDDYNLMIVLPEQAFGLERLLAVMRSEVLGEQVSLRRLNEKLERKWVRAQLPKFNLKGNVLFTNDLQKLGVIELFQPKRADFSHMTDEHDDLYVKHLEQSIDLTIRTQSVKSIMDAPKKYEEINVNYPFLYFIMDKEIDMAIICGRILNPLNARIQ